MGLFLTWTTGSPGLESIYRRCVIIIRTRIVGAVMAAAMAIALAGFAQAGGPVYPSNLKVMPLGDSITYGGGGSERGYRGPLYNLLELRRVRLPVCRGIDVEPRQPARQRAAAQRLFVLCHVGSFEQSRRARHHPSTTSYGGGGAKPQRRLLAHRRPRHRPQRGVPGCRAAAGRQPTTLLWAI